MGWLSQRDSCENTHEQLSNSIQSKEINIDQYGQ